MPIRRSIQAVSIVLALLLAGCSASHETSNPVGSSATASSSSTPVVAAADWKVFSFNGVSFRYPPSWISYQYHWASTESDSVTYLSTTYVPNPCTTTATRGGIETACGQLTGHLGPNGVSVVWTEWDGPAFAGFDPLANEPGDSTNFAGHLAKVVQGAAGTDCGSIGAQTSISAVIERAPRPSMATLNVTACLGPQDVSANAADVMAMLRTISVSG